MNTDINLLFGVLALQAELIDTARFAEACTAWTARKDTRLADLLVERGWLTPDDRADIERLLDRKLKRHGGDVRASLDSAANDQARRALAALNDPDIDRSIGDRSQDDYALTVSLLPTASHHPETRDRYALAHIHARGGIGQVWLARDGELGRNVALKELRPERAEDPRNWARFLKEAQITGQLEHPGIVPIYELARRSKDQQPFYTMRFVKGHTLSEAIATYHQKQAAGQAGPRDLQDLLNAFISVCNAIAYAHSRGVIHRDLKPQNVALGDFGEVMVLDWGLAKLVDVPEEDSGTSLVELPKEPGETVPGQVLGSPAYMAPEQAAGQVDRIERRSDVYGLGAILYELLTGRPPFSGSDSHEVIRKVQTEAPEKPRQVCRDVPPALEAVCLRALAKKPEDRYASVKELAEEVKRWLADQPVNAWPEPWPARARRWMGRHRTLLTTSVAFLITAVVSLAIGTVRLEWERSRTDTARLEAVKNLNEAKRQAEIAKTNENEARHQQQRAEANLAKFRTAVDKHWLVQISDNLKEWESNSSNQDLFMKRMLDDTLVFLQSAIDSTSGDPLAEADSARLYISMGLVYYLKARVDDALSMFRKAISQYEKTVEVFPNVAAYRQKLVETNHLVGMLFTDNRRWDEAIVAFRKAIELDPKFALAYSNLGWALGEKKRYDEAIPILHKAIELDSKLAEAHNNLGWALNGKGQYDEAIPSLRKALELDPKDAKAQNNLGYALNRKRQYDEAIPILRKAIDLDPNHATAHNNLGSALNGKGHYDEAVPILRRAIEINPRYATAHNNLGYALNRKQRYDEAIPILRKAIEINSRYATAYNNLGWALIEKRQYDEAIPILRKAIELDPKQVNARNHLGRALNEKGRYDEAIPILREAVAINPNHRSAHNNLGWVLNEKGWYDEAIPILRKAIELDPKDPYAQDSFFGTLLAAGRFPEALEAARHYQQSVKPDDPQRQDIDQMVHRAELMIELERKRPAILRSEIQLANDTELTTFPEMCQSKKLYAISARFWLDAFTAKPQLAADMNADHRYSAACAAARAAAGQGQDAEKLDEKERARWRQQARDWLRADLEAWNLILENGTPEDRAAIQPTLAHWKVDPHLASIRDDDLLAKLPEAERTAFRRSGRMWQASWPAPVVRSDGTDPFQMMSHTFFRTAAVRGRDGPGVVAPGPVGREPPGACVAIPSRRVAAARRLDRRKRGRNVERRRESPSEGHRRRGRKSPGIGPPHGRLRARVTERPAGRSVAGPSAAPYWENRAITFFGTALPGSRTRPLLPRFQPIHRSPPILSTTAEQLRGGLRYRLAFSHSTESMVTEVGEAYEIEDQALLPQAVAMASAQQRQGEGHQHMEDDPEASRVAEQPPVMPEQEQHQEEGTQEVEIL